MKEPKNETNGSEPEWVRTMPSPVLVDTSVWISVFRDEAGEHVQRGVDHLLAENKIAIPGIVMLELLSGANTRDEYDELREELQALIQLTLSEETWTEAASLSFHLRREGVTVPSTDTLIFTIAVEHNCGVLHADRHFDLIVEHADHISTDLVVNTGSL